MAVVAQSACTTKLVVFSIRKRAASQQCWTKCAAAWCSLRRRPQLQVARRVEAWGVSTGNTDTRAPHVRCQNSQAHSCTLATSHKALAALHHAGGSAAQQPGQAAAATASSCCRQRWVWQSHWYSWGVAAVPSPKGLHHERSSQAGTFSAHLVVQGISGASWLSSMPQTGD